MFLAFVPVMTHSPGVPMFAGLASPSSWSMPAALTMARS
jgi:hypothetical protein